METNRALEIQMQMQIQKHMNVYFCSSFLSLSTYPCLEFYLSIMYLFNCSVVLCSVSCGVFLFPVLFLFAVFFVFSPYMPFCPVVLRLVLVLFLSLAFPSTLTVLVLLLLFFDVCV